MNGSNYLATVLVLFVLIVLFNQWRRGTLRQWIRAKFLNIGPAGPAPSTGSGGAFAGPSSNPAGSGGGGGGAW